MHNLAQLNPIDTVVSLIVFAGDGCTPAVFTVDNMCNAAASAESTNVMVLLRSNGVV
jgi:hypothetical protein